MLKRFLLTCLCLIILPLAVLLSGLPLYLLRSELDGSTLLMAACLWGAIILLVLIPVGNEALRRIWVYRGSGDPVSLDQIRQRLLTVNAMDCPVTALTKRKKIVLTWRYRETRWCELFSRLGINRLYELHCRFDADTRTVYLMDRQRTADFIICPDRVKTGRLRIPLPLLRLRAKRLIAIEQYAIQAEHEYNFHPREIKSPVLGTILASGWHVRLSLF
jgi:hypothetical protein